MKDIIIAGAVASIATLAIERGMKDEAVGKHDLDAIRVEIGDEGGGTAWREFHRRGDEFVAGIGEDGDDDALGCAVIYDKDARAVKIAVNRDAGTRTAQGGGQGAKGGRCESTDDGADGHDEKIMGKRTHGGYYTKKEGRDE